MKEFHSNKFHLYLFPDHEERYKYLITKLQTISQREDFTLLKDVIRIFTREKITSNYLSIEIVRDEFPSLYFQADPLRKIFTEVLKNVEDKNVINDSTCIFILTDIIKKKTKLKNTRAIFALANDIFKEWNESLRNMQPIHLKKEHDDILKEFLKIKKNFFTINEYTRDSILNLKFKSNEEILNNLGKDIFVYGVFEMDMLSFKLLEYLSQILSVHIFLTLPRLDFIHSNPLEKNLEDLLPEESFLRLIEPKLKFKELVDADSFEQNKNLPNLVIRSTQEIYREVDFVARDILRKIDSRNEKFPLNKIKIILPDLETYQATLMQVFTKMEIPYSCTKNIKVKFSPYFSAIISLLTIIESDFSKDELFSLFNNPCFLPSLRESSPTEIRSDVWSRIISKLNIESFLDETDRSQKGYRKNSLLTWSSIWKRLSLLSFESNSEINLDPEEQEELESFLFVTSSFLNDIIFLQEDYSKLDDVSLFLKTLESTYLNSNYTGSNEQDRYMSLYIKNQFYSILSNYSQSFIELKKMGFEVKLDLFYFIDLIKSELSSLLYSDSKLIRSGVVVGTYIDTIDPCFDFIYYVGLDENLFSTSQNSSIQEVEESLELNKIKNDSLKQKIYFYSIFNHKPKEIALSYINLDSIKDRVKYPYSEVDRIKSKYPQNLIKTESIYLSLLEESSSINASEIKLDKKALDLMNIEILNLKIPNLSLLSPSWDRNENSLDIPEKINRYLFRKKSSKIKTENVYDFFSASKWRKYLECPKKYLYDTSFSSDSNESIGELKEFTALNWYQIVHKLLEIKSVYNYSNPKDYIDILNQSATIEAGEYPYGLLGEVATIILKEYLENYFISFFKNQNFSNIIYRPLFNSNLKKIDNKPIFSSIIDDDLGECRMNFDLLIQKETILYLVNLSTSEPKPLKLLELNFNTSLVQKYSQKELNEFFKTKDLVIQPAILLVEKVKELFLTETKFEFDKEHPFFKESNQLFKENFFPAKPFKETLCDYCNFKPNCFGYSKGFEEFLSEDSVLFLNSINSKAK
jgi:hypothetical protein